MGEPDLKIEQFVEAVTCPKADITHMFLKEPTSNPHFYACAPRFVCSG